MKKCALIIAPYYKDSGYIGNYRIQRFINWLNDQQYEVKIIWSGWKDEVIEKARITEVEIRDPLRRFTRIKSNINHKNEFKKLKRISLRYLIQKIVFYFDRTFIWSLLITRKKIISDLCKQSNLVISSNPPESTHLASYILSKKYKLQLLIDMRDGWLDEPMRNYRRNFSFKKGIEKYLEKKILLYSSRIFVTSENWKSLLINRIKQVKDKVVVLTNAYPESFNLKVDIKKSYHASELYLLHTGRFTGTRKTNRLGILLEPLYRVLKDNSSLLTNIVLIGDLLPADQQELILWRSLFNTTTSKLIIREKMDRSLVFQELLKADGLLLLAATKAFFPSKTFEYILTRKPILAVTLQESTIWEAGQKVKQMFLYDYTSAKKDLLPVHAFIEACKTGEYDSNIPEEYSEKYLSRIFLNALKELPRDVKSQV